MGSVAKSYMRKGFLIYEAMRKYLTLSRPLVICDFATDPFWIFCYTRGKFSFLFYQCVANKVRVTGGTVPGRHKGHWTAGSHPNRLTCRYRNARRGSWSTQQSAFLKGRTVDPISVRLDLFKKLGMIWKDWDNSTSFFKQENLRDNPVPNPRDSWNGKSASSRVFVWVYMTLLSTVVERDDLWKR